MREKMKRAALLAGATALCLFVVACAPRPISGERSTGGQGIPSPTQHP
jgi:hypothetical protein